MKRLPAMPKVEISLLTPEGNSKPVHQKWWFWVLLIGGVVLSFASGALASGGSFDDEVFLADPSASVHAGRGDVEAARRMQAGTKAQHLAQINKLLKRGVIESIDERKRLLYVNDAVWKVFSYDQKEQTVRVVAEYLDWVHATETGMLDVLSHRTGRRLMSTY